MPDQEEEETDELLLLDEEMLDADPEDLPRRLLTNFAIYNAEVGALTMHTWILCPMSMGMGFFVDHKGQLQYSR